MHVYLELQKVDCIDEAVPARVVLVLPLVGKMHPSPLYLSIVKNTYAEHVESAVINEF